MVLSSRAIQIDGFTFDPKALKECFFVAGTSDKPDATGEKLRTEGEKSPAPISKPYSAVNVMIELPAGKGVCMFKWFAIWDEANKKSLGWVKFESEKWVIPPEMGQNLPDAAGGSTEAPSSPKTSVMTTPKTTPKKTAETEHTRHRAPETTTEETTTKGDDAAAALESSYGNLNSLALYLALPYSGR